MKYCLYGNDLLDTINPIQSGLNWVVDLSKEDPGLVSKNISGMFEIIVPLTTPVKDWLPTLDSALTEIIGE